MAEAQRLGNLRRLLLAAVPLFIQPAPLLPVLQPVTWAAVMAHLTDMESLACIIALTSHSQYWGFSFKLTVTAFWGPVDRPCLHEAMSVYISLHSKPSVSIPHRLFLVYLGLSLVYICLPRVDYVCLPRSTTAPTPRDSPPPSATSSGVSIVLGH
jgi:hypothetical protein